MMHTPLIILTSNAGFKICNSNNLAFNPLDPLDTHNADFERVCGKVWTDRHLHSLFTVCQALC